MRLVRTVLQWCRARKLGILIWLGYSVLISFPSLIWRHLFFLSFVGTSLTLWVWMKVNQKLREAEEANDGTDLIWGFMYMYAMAAMIGMPVALAATAPPWFFNWRVWVVVLSTLLSAYLLTSLALTCAFWRGCYLNVEIMKLSWASTGFFSMFVLVTKNLWQIALKSMAEKLQKACRWVVR